MLKAVGKNAGSRRRGASHGFTLIELAVVIAIVGLLVAGAVTGFGAMRTNTKIRETHRHLESAELLLKSFVARNARLPCPADPTLAPGAAAYARESNTAGAGTTCAVARRIGATGVYWGSLPAMDLGAVPREITDGWGNQFYYVVVGNAALTNSLTFGSWAQDDATNEIELWDKADNDASLPARQRIVDQGVVALISAGPNGSGAYTLGGSRLPVAVATALAENDNQDADIFFAVRDYSEDDAAPFDDIVRVYTDDDIILALAETGSIETKRALTLTRMKRIVDVIYGRAAADANQRIPDESAPLLGVEGTGNGGFPYNNYFPANAETGFDGWGAEFQYTAHARREVCTGDGALAVSTDDLFSLSSATIPALNITHTRAEAVGRINPGVILSACP